VYLIRSAQLVDGTFEGVVSLSGENMSYLYTVEVSMGTWVTSVYYLNEIKLLQMMIF